MNIKNIALLAMFIIILGMVILGYINDILDDNEQLETDKAKQEQTIKHQKIRNEYQQQQAKRQVEVVKDTSKVENQVKEEGEDEEDFITASPTK